jgi:hypothetical protein
MKPFDDSFDGWPAWQEDLKVFRRARALPMRRDMITLLIYVRDNKVVGTPSTGNMPRKAIREVTAHFVDPPVLDTSIGDRVYKLRTEFDVWPLYFLHVLAEVGELVQIAPGRRWRLTEGGEAFLTQDPLTQISFLLTIWWHKVNWLVAYPWGGLGDVLPVAVPWLTLAFLSRLEVEEAIPFEPFADTLLEILAPIWPPPDSRPRFNNPRTAVKWMFIDVLDAFGIIKSHYSDLPGYERSYRALEGFEVTPFGQHMLDFLLSTAVDIGGMG